MFFFTGLLCTIPSVFVQAKSTSYDFEATAEQSSAELIDFWIGEDGTQHIILYKVNDLLDGKINGKDFTGETQETLHIKFLSDGGTIVNGRGTFFIEYEGKIGTFSGTIKAQLIGGQLKGKFTMQGSGCFEGMKLSGELLNTSPTTNELTGTILVPSSRDL